MSEPTTRRADHGGRRPWLRPVDFQAPSALAPDQQARLRRMADEVCDVVAARALTDLSMTIHLEPLEMRETTWRDAQRVPAEESITTTIDASGGGSLYLVMDPALASVLVERLLGADPDPSLPPRPLTAIDRSLLRRVNELIIASWDQLWVDATATTLRPAQTPAQPHRMLALELDAGAPTLLIAFQVRLGGTYAVLHVLLPQATVQPVAPQLSKPSQRGSSDDPAATQAVQNRVGQAGVAVHVRLGKVRMDAASIAALHPGDRVPLGAAPDAPATLVVDGVTVQFGHVGRSGTRRAVQIGAGMAHQGVA